MTEKLLSVKELAAELGRNRGYIFAMKEAGFVMPGSRATLSEARAWLAANPKFSSTAYNKKKSNPVKTGRKPNMYLPDMPGGFNERICFFSDGEDVINHPDLGVCDQVVLDHQTGQEGFEDEYLGKLLRGKIEELNFEFFEALSRSLRRKKESTGPLDPVRLEMVIIKQRAERDGEELTWQQVSDELSHCTADKKTIESAAKAMGWNLLKMPRGRPKNK